MSTSPTGWVPVDPPGRGADATVTGPSTDPDDGPGTPTGWVPAAPARPDHGVTPAQGAPRTAGPSSAPAPAPPRTPAPVPASPAGGPASTNRVPASTAGTASTGPMAASALAGPTTDEVPDAEPEPEAEPDAAPDAAPDDRPPAEVVRHAVLTASGVVALSGGTLGEVATFLPGRRVPGVRLGPGPGDPLEVHVVAAYGTPVAETAAAVRAALAGLPPSAGVAGRPVHVVVDDVALPGAPGTDTAAPGPR